MKKIALFFLLFPLSLLAQESEQFGFKVGPSIINLRSTVTGQQLNYSYNWRIGYQVGMVYKYNMANGYTSFMLDILYAQKGTKQGVLVQNGNYNVKLHYLNVPLLFAYKATETFDVYAGTELGLLINSQVSFRGQSIDLGDQYKRFELNPIIGLQFTMPSNIFFDARYTFGVLDIDKPTDSSGNATQGVNSVKTVTQSFQFSIGYYFSRNEF